MKIITFTTIILIFLLSSCFNSNSNNEEKIVSKKSNQKVIVTNEKDAETMRKESLKIKHKTQLNDKKFNKENLDDKKELKKDAEWYFKNQSIKEKEYRKASNEAIRKYMEEIRAKYN